MSTVTLEGRTFHDATLIAGPVPIVAQSKNGTSCFTRIVNGREQTGGPRVALRWAESTGMTIPDTFLHGRDGRHYGAKSSKRSVWSDLKAGERRVIPLDALAKRLWPSDRQARITLEGDELIVEVPNV